MVLKFGKRGIHSGNTLRTPCWKYLRQYRSCSFVIREDLNVNGDDIASGKFDIDDIHSSGIQYSLNKKGRWRLPKILIGAIKAGKFDLEDYGVQLFEKHNTSDKYANCVSAYFSRGKIKEITVFRKTGKRKKRRSGYMCLHNLKNRNDGITRKNKRPRYLKWYMYMSDAELNPFYPSKSEKKEITYKVVYPSPLHSLLTHNYWCVGHTIIEKTTDKRTKNKMLRRYIQDIIKSDISCFLEDSNTPHEHSDSDYHDMVDETKSTERSQVNDFLVYALNNSRIKQTEQNNALNDFVVVSDYEQWLPQSEPVDQPVRVILNHNDTNRDRIAGVYGNKCVECLCSPRKFIIDVSDDVMAFDVISRDWKLSVKQVHACVVFVHDIENEINTAEDQVYKIYFNTSVTTDMKKIRVTTIFDYTETSVDECLSRAMFFIESLPDLIQTRDDTCNYHHTSPQSGIANLCGWKSRNYIPNDKFHYKAFMTSCQARLASSIEENSTADIFMSTEFGQLCGICFDDISLESPGTALSQCGHWFCDNCWEEYLKVKLKSGSIYLDCPEHSCKSEVDNGTLISILCIEDVIRFAKFRHDIDVDRRNETKWCPNVRCGRVLVRNHPGVPAVTCDCGEKVCFDCLGPAHWPAPCQSVRPYQHVLHEIGVTKDVMDTTCLLAVYGMHCPNCNRFFEKIDGCPRMICLCNKSFCWGCGKDWSSNIHGKRCETLGRKDVHIDLTCRFLYSASLQNEWIDAALEHRLYQQPHKIRQLRSNTQHIAKALTTYMNNSSRNISLHFTGSRKVYAKESQKIPEFLQSLFMINYELHCIAENIALSLGYDFRAVDNEYFKLLLKRLTFYCRTIEECLSQPVKSALSRLRRLKEMRSVSFRLIKILVAYTTPKGSNARAYDVAKCVSVV